MYDEERTPSTRSSLCTCANINKIIAHFQGRPHTEEQRKNSSEYGGERDSGWKENKWVSLHISTKSRKTSSSKSPRNPSDWLTQLARWNYYYIPRVFAYEMFFLVFGVSLRGKKLKWFTTSSKYSPGKLLLRRCGRVLSLTAENLWILITAIYQTASRMAESNGEIFQGTAL